MCPEVVKASQCAKHMEKETELEEWSGRRQGEERGRAQRVQLWLQDGRSALSLSQTKDTLFVLLIIIV